MGETETEVVIVGGGPAGIAVSACLNRLGVPNVVLEKEDCYAPLWKKWAYDRLKLHIGKQYCELPMMPHPAAAPTFVPKDEFVGYLDAYVARFGVRPLCGRAVVSAGFDGGRGAWRVVARDAAATGEEEAYVSRFLVVATGENAEGVVPEVPGLGSFPGDVLHSGRYKSGAKFAGKRVLVVGSGNSGMEIALDLCNHGAMTSISVRGPFHVVSKEIVYLGMALSRYISLPLVDAMALLLCWLKYGDLSELGIQRPAEGPFSLKMKTGRSPVIDVGTVAKIKSGEIQLMKVVSSVNGDEVTFADGRTRSFDAIIFATGYKSTARNWLKDDGGLLNKEGFPAKRPPDHWKGEKGLYCAGLSRNGLHGVAADAKAIADDIHRAARGSGDRRLPRRRSGGETGEKMKTT